ncbi:hypothetical protein GCM10011390_19810 [Aureimonas endophytica]|uniref:Uncharacterized protein n=2 Tax=Aureimonas endophytica TaxID=2027858 RepID=A0A916ZJH3_9HYPH|nr:hypothetical protein GCM10011390_19810 [Aureimonas endophytica]
MVGDMGLHSCVRHYRFGCGAALALMLMAGTALAQAPAQPEAAAPSSVPMAGGGAPAANDAAAAPSAVQPAAPAAGESAAAAPAAAATSPADPALAAAQPSGCFVPPAKLSDREVSDFLARPASVFEDYGSNTLSLSNRFRALAGSDRRTIDPIIALANGASAVQKAAIGSGLGRAAFACSKVDAVYAADIQSKVADINLPELLTAFVTASNDIQVAAIGAGGGGAAAGASGLSGGGIAGPGSAGLGGDDVVPTTYSLPGPRNAIQYIRVGDSGGDSSDSSVPSPSRSGG